MVGWFKHVIAPILAAAIVLLAQLAIQPMIEKRSVTKTQLWLQKKEVYEEAAFFFTKK